MLVHVWVSVHDVLGSSLSLSCRMSVFVDKAKKLGRTESYVRQLDRFVCVCHCTVFSVEIIYGLC